MNWMDTVIGLADLSREEFSTAREQLAQGDKAGCAEKIIAHFRTRTTPHYLFFRPGPAEKHGPAPD